MTPSGIEPVAFRFVAQHHNHCATAVPTDSSLIRIKSKSLGLGKIPWFGGRSIPSFCDDYHEISSTAGNLPKCTKFSSKSWIMTRFVRVTQLARNNRFQSSECLLTMSLCTKYLLRTAIACIQTYVTLSVTTCGTTVKPGPPWVSLQIHWHVHSSLHSYFGPTV